MSQIEDSVQYLEGPNGIWKNHVRHIGVHLFSTWNWKGLMVSGSSGWIDRLVHLDPNMPVMELPDAIWSFQVLNRVLYL